MDYIRYSVSKARIRKLKMVNLSIFNPDEVQKYSNLNVGSIFIKNDYYIDEINSNKLGIIENKVRCSIDQSNVLNCPGYFGHVDLALPVYNVNYITTLFKVLKSINFLNSKILLKFNQDGYSEVKNESRFMTRLNLISNLSEKVKLNDLTGEKLPKYFLEGNKIYYELPVITGKKTYNPNSLIRNELLAEVTYNILKRISKEDCIFLGFDFYNIRPNWLIVYSLPIPPVSIRPYCKKNPIEKSEDDLTYKLHDIVRVNQRLKKVVAGRKSMNLINHYRNLLSFHVSTYFDNSSKCFPLAIQRSGKPIKGIVQRLNGKYGRIRRNLLGKRVDFSGRTVITGDSFLKMSQLGIPIIMSKKLTIPEIVNRYNIDRLSSIVDSFGDNLKANYVFKGLERRLDIRFRTIDSIILLKYGFVVERHLVNNDLVVLNRQPSLHKMSMMGHRVKILPKNTLRLNLSVTTPYNADFDGDEMNIHIPQNKNIESEIITIISAIENIVSPQSNKPVMGLVQDSLLGASILTSRDCFLDDVTFKTITYLSSKKINSLTHFPSILRPYNLWSGKQLVNETIPDLLTTDIGKLSSNVAWIKNLNFLENLLYVFEKTLIMGSLNKKAVGVSYHSLIHYVNSDHSSKVSSRFINKMQPLVRDWILFHGFSLGVNDFFKEISIVLLLRVMINEVLKAWDLKKKVLLRKLIMIDFLKISQKTIRSSIFSSKLHNFISSIRYVLFECIGLQNNVGQMINSGSKGSAVNLIQIMGSLGQQSITNYNSLLSLKKVAFYHSISIEEPFVSIGFIRGSFLVGLSPHEFFFHSISGREGIIDTSIKTAETGYIQRKLSKSMENLLTHYDGSVRISDESIIQFLYGEDGFNPRYLEIQPNSMITATERRRYLENIECTIKCGNKGIISSEKSDIFSKYSKFYFRRNYKVMARFFESVNYKVIFLPLNILRLISLCKHSKISGKIYSQFRLKHSKTFLFVTDIIKKIFSSIYLPSDLGSKLSNSSQLFFDLLVRKFKPDVFEKYKMSINSCKWLFNRIFFKFINSLLSPGECVGVLSAQSIGEPTTQMTLNTFHYAGIAEKDVTTGIPRFNELINASKSIKSPKSYLCVKKNKNLEIESINYIASKLSFLSVNSLCKRIEIYYYKSSHIILNLNKIARLIYNIPEKESFIGFGFKNWLFKLELDRNKLKINFIKFTDLLNRISEHFKNVLVFKGTNENSEVLIMEIFLKNNKKIKKIFSSKNNFEKKLILLKNEILLIHISGIHNISNFVLSDNIKTYVFNKYKFRNVIFNITIFEGLGVDIVKTIQFPWVNIELSYCNNIVEFFDVFGIEGTRNLLSKELKKILEFDGSYINDHHINCLVDYMTNLGFVNSVNRYGLKYQAVSAMQQCSFEETAKIIFKTSLLNIVDSLNSITDKIITGNICDYGTTFFSINKISELEHAGLNINSLKKNRNIRFVSNLHSFNKVKFPKFKTNSEIIKKYLDWDY